MFHIILLFLMLTLIKYTLVGVIEIMPNVFITTLNRYLTSGLMSFVSLSGYNVMQELLINEIWLLAFAVKTPD